MDLKSAKHPEEATGEQTVDCQKQHVCRLGIACDVVGTELAEKLSA
jgi:hypothetical protein